MDRPRRHPDPLEVNFDRVAEILAGQFRRTLQLLGVTSVGELRARGSELLRRSRSQQTLA
jgi:isopentenyl diphosphate isomerase/L-lactate dehydrogenase-like FMN-dependent dehydrogenase